MFFTIGIETPKNNNDKAYGIVIPALCTDGYSCLSSAESESCIPAAATEAILQAIQYMIESGKYDIKNIKNEHVLFMNNKEYSNYDSWLMIDVDLSNFSGKQKRINISLSDVLINRIDNAVKANSSMYKDRSNFLSEAAINALSELSELSNVTGKNTRFSVILPDVLIERIDNLVKTKSSMYKDRNNFIAEAAVSILSSANRTY